MKVTKYPQSCLIIENNGKRLVIDPGSLVTAHYKATDLLPLDGILITHEHQDHADPKLIQALVGQTSIPVYANQSTSQAVQNCVTQIVNNGEQFEVAGFKIVAYELPHCAMVDGTQGPQNTGYLIDGVFFHPGDGTQITGLQVNTAAVPIAGPDISPHDVFSFIRSVGCKTAIPIHYDIFPAEPKFYKELFANSLFNKEKLGVDIVTLSNGESTEVL